MNLAFARRRLGAAALASLLLAAPLTPAWAATITVGPSCTLANAINSANQNAAIGGCAVGSGADTIELPANSLVSLTLAAPLPTVTSIITLNGNGSTVQRTGGTGGLLGLSGTGANLTLNRLTLKGASGASAVHCNGNYTLTVNESTFTANSNSSGFGAAILADGGCVLTVMNSTLHGNSAIVGGAIFSGGPLTISNSTISGNSASFTGGGGLWIKPSIVATVTSTTITGNTAANGSGGGVYSAGATLTLRGNVISGNRAKNQQEIARIQGTLNSSGNVFGHDGLTTEQAGGVVGGVNATSNGGTPKALASILNTTLADNGGPTQTHNLVAGSPAIDLAGDCAAANPKDQRGVSRPQGAACDAGAVEFVAPPTVTALSPAKGPAAGGTSVTITGTGLTGASAVKFGGTDATAFTVNNDTQVTATSPAGTGTVNVIVTAATGSSASAAGNQFEYQDSEPGACGTANGVATSAAPTANLCATGTASAVNGTSNWTWTCAGTGSSTQNASCSAPYQTQTINGFTANPANVLVGATSMLSASATSGLMVSFASDTPTTCSVSGSTATALAAGTCTLRASQPGANTGNSRFQPATSVTTTVQVRQNGTCGSAHQPLSASGSAMAPTSGLCATGSATLVSGSNGAWRWTCNGENGGVASNECSVPYASQTLSLSLMPTTIPALKTSMAMASSTGGLTVSLAATPAEVCTVSGTTVTGVTEGSCTVTASQPGTGDSGTSRYRAAVDQVAMLTVLSPCEAYVDEPGVNIIDLRESPGGQTVRGVAGRFNVIFGSNMADTITGGNAGNCIDARGGNDRLSGGGGNTLLFGGAGNDALTPGSASTTMNGGAGNDSCGRASGRATVTYTSCETQ